MKIKRIVNEKVKMKESQRNYVIKKVFNKIIDEINIHIENLIFCNTIEELKLQEGAIWALLRLIETYDIDRITTKAYEEIDNVIEETFEKINKRIKELLK